jgi:hypothetical protein
MTWLQANRGSILRRSVEGKEQDAAVFDLILMDEINEEAVIKNLRNMLVGRMYRIPFFSLAYVAHVNASIAHSLLWQGEICNEPNSAFEY